MIKKLKKRLLETLILVKIIRVSFEDHARKLLKILEFDDDYNHEIGAIDEGNKLKRSNIYKIIYRKGGA